MRSVVDHNAIKFTQMGIVALVTVAWLAGLPALVALLALALLVGVAWPAGAPLRRLYSHVAVPLGLVRPHLVPDEPAPHRFAQGVGALFLVAATGALYGGLSSLGWVLGAVVAVLAAVNVLWDFCAGCFVYYQLRRVGLVGRRPQAGRA
jgi:hypothetical protein